jgi:hypothetical protein
MAFKTGKATSASSFATGRTTSSIPSEHSSVGGHAEALGNIGTHHDDDDLGPDKKSSLSTGMYIITNVGRKKRAALCFPKKLAGVVASLDGTNLIPEAGEEVSDHV